MNRFNATVTGGFTGRDGKIRLWVRPDKGEPRQVIHDTALDEGKRVRLDGGRIEAVQ